MWGLSLNFIFSSTLLESRHQTHCMQQLSSFWKWFQLTQCHAITEAAEQTQEASGWIIHMMSESGSPNHNDTKLRATTWAVDCDKAVKSTAAIPSTRCWPRCTIAGSGCHLQGLNLNIMSRAAAYAGVHFPFTFTKKYEWMLSSKSLPTSGSSGSTLMITLSPRFIMRPLIPWTGQFLMT